MKKKSFLRNAILLSLLVGATTVYSPVVMAAEDVAASGDFMEFAMEEYVVTASRTQTAKVDTPANVSTIDAAKIESRRYQDVAEALKDVPGVAVVDNGYGAMEKTVTLNGDDRVEELEDGKFTIAIAIPESEQKYDAYKVIYIDEDGKIADTLDAKLVDGKVVFTTSHLSTYGVVGYNNVTETPTETKPEKNPTTSDINLALIISAIVISTIGVVITSKKISAKVTR